jgi:hypothetical protein
LLLAMIAVKSVALSACTLRRLSLSIWDIFLFCFLVCPGKTGCGANTDFFSIILTVAQLWESLKGRPGWGANPGFLI